MAGIVDAVVVVLLVTLGLVCVNGLSFVLDPRGFRLVGASQEAMVGAALATAVLYLASTWTLLGRSYGSRLMGLRIVDRRGRPPRAVRSLLRATFCIFFPLGLLWCAVARSRKSVQDLVLGTSVVYDWMPEHQPRGMPA